MPKETLVVLASVLAIVGNLPYLRDTIKGRIKPHPYTWFVGSVVSCVIFFGQLAKGAGIGAIPTLVSEVFTVIIFLFSLRYGFKNPPKIDKYFLAFAILGILPWIITKDPTLSVITVVSIDLVAFFPTFRKTFRDPTSESSLLYAANASRHIFALGALSAYNIATTLHSVAMIITNISMLAMIKARKRA